MRSLSCSAVRRSARACVSWGLVAFPGAMTFFRLGRFGMKHGLTRTGDGERDLAMGSLPLAQRLDVRRRAVAQPAVELGLVLELLAAAARDDDEARNRSPAARVMSPQSFSNCATGKTSSWPWPQRFFTSFSVM